MHSQFHQPTPKPNLHCIMNSRTLHAFHLILHFAFYLAFLPFLSYSLETDTISSNILLRDPDTIVSRHQLFKLGFFSPENSTHRYLGVFHAVSKNSIVWVANRDKPLTDSSGTVTISSNGNLVLTNGANKTIWSTSTNGMSNATAQILDTGNLVLRRVGSSENASLWESFSHPSSVYVPTMRISENTKTGEKVVLSAWRTGSDPGVGSFTSGVLARNIPEIFIWNNDGRTHWRSGPWNGRILIGLQDMYGEFINRFAEFNNDNGTVYFMIPPTSFMTKVELSWSGKLMQDVWNNQSRSWDPAWIAPKTQCDVYGTCGEFGSCNALESPICSCLSGFEPVDGEEWGRGNWSGGCRRRNQLQCGQSGNSNNDTGNIDTFLRMQFMKVPDFAERFPHGQEDVCRSRCLSNCSCIAYAHDPTIGCMFWSQSLMDVQRFADNVGVDLYIRLSASEFDSHNDSKLIIIIPAIVGGVVSIAFIVLIAWCLIVKRKKANKKKIIEAGQTFSSDSTAIVLKDELENANIEELPLFSFQTLANATDHFHENNLLGRGGFGSVYKGNLGNGNEIAVKRLSAASGQGMEEFMNEVIVISKLQHRNLVRLLGCSVDKEEKMLVYEYMPNKSLDVCLFDSTHPSQNILDWKKRISIIEGIGRGLMYLHKDSRLKIIHRDLKPSNVLLDEEWNPKISDFGMARIFGGNEDHGNTARVVGTYGYMAPEYAMEGQFSEKSDVYSFGVLVLEIVKGEKNTHYYNHEWSLGLLGCAWKLWSEDKVLAFGEESVAIGSDYDAEMVSRCIQIGLLCVQEDPKDRPTIQTVLAMLNREIVDLPHPGQPLFAEKWNVETTQPLTGQVGYSVNRGLTLTVLDGR